jgi:hypothetical protein
MANKYLNVGSILKGKDKKGEEYEYMVFDNFNLKQLVDFLSEFGNTHLKGKDVTDKKLPKIRVGMYKPNEKAPDFIVKNLAIKLESEE